MPQVDPPLVVHVVRRHVVGADPVVDARAGPADGRHHVVARRQLGHVGPDRLHPAEALVAGHEKVVARRRGAVLGRVDLLVGAVHADPQHLDQHARPSGTSATRWLWAASRRCIVLGLPGKTAIAFIVGWRPVSRLDTIGGRPRLAPLRRCSAWTSPSALRVERHDRRGRGPGARVEIRARCRAASTGPGEMSRKLPLPDHSPRRRRRRAPDTVVCQCTRSLGRSSGG